MFDTCLTQRSNSRIDLSSIPCVVHQDTASYCEPSLNHKVYVISHTNIFLLAVIVATVSHYLFTNVFVHPLKFLCQFFPLDLQSRIIVS